MNGTSQLGGSKAYILWNLCDIDRTTLYGYLVGSSDFNFLVELLRIVHWTHKQLFTLRGVSPKEKRSRVLGRMEETPGI